MKREKLSHRDVERAIETAAGSCSRYLAGVTPSVPIALRMRDRLGIPIESWAVPRAAAA